jgi:GTP-binding protein EngB required for normal cell division
MSDSDFDLLRDQVLALFPELLDVVGPDLSAAAKEVLVAGRDRLAAGRYRVVVCGEFRRGKSSLLNALLERPRLFPVDVDVTTCAVMTLAWGEQETAVAWLRDAAKPDRPPRRVDLALADVREFVTEQANPGNQRQVELVEITAPIPALETGLVLVDTPGIGSMNAEHTAATYSFLPNADAILFVTSAMAPLSSRELDFLADALERSPVVVVAVTMIDKVVSATPIVDEARKRVAARTGLDADGLLVVALSSARRQQATVEPDEELKAELVAESGFPTLEAELWGGLAAGCGVAQLGWALDALDGTLALAAAPVANELAALAAGGEPKKIEAELVAATEQARRLQSDTAGWREELAHTLRAESRQVRRRLDEDFEAIRTQVHDAVKADADPDALVSQVSAAMVDAVNAANGDLMRLAEYVCADFATRTALTLTAPTASDSGFVARVSAPRLTASSGSTDLRKATRAVQAGRMFYTGGAVGGALVGTAVMPGIGTVIGGALGALFGLISGSVAGYRDTARADGERAARERRSQLRSHLDQTVRTNRERALRAFDEALSDVTHLVRQELNQQVGLARESLDQSVRRLRENKKRSERDLVRRRAELEERLAGYEKLRTRLEGVRASAGHLRRPSSPAPTDDTNAQHDGG